MTKPTASPDVTELRLREIIAGCEGVTPGPWMATTDALDAGEGLVSHVVRPLVADQNGVRYLPVLPRIELPIIGTLQTDEINWPLAQHIARLDPQTVSSMASELLALRQEVERLTRDLHSMTDLEELQAKSLDETDAELQAAKASLRLATQRREEPDIAVIEATARKINPGRSEDHIKSVAMDALSIFRALALQPKEN